MSDVDQVSRIWSRAIQQYEAITKTKLDVPSWAEAKTVESMLQLIDRENASFSSYRSKGEKIRTVVKYAMAPVELVGEIAASGAAIAFPPSSVIFAAVSHLINAANGISHKYDAIIEMMSDLKDFTIRLETYSQQRISPRLSEKLAQILTTVLEVLAFTRQEIKHGRILSFGKSLLQGNDGAKASVDKLEKLFHSESSLVGADTLSQVKGTNVTLLHVQEDVTEIKHMLASEPREAPLIEIVQDVLKPSNYAEDRFNTINRSRVPNTGDWISAEREFKAWETGESPMLWVCGTPGAGKSYIASNIISRLKKKYPQQIQHSSQVSVGYFFYKDDNSETRSIGRSLRDVAFQIALNDPLYAQHVVSNKDTLHSTSTISTLWRLLFVKYFVGSDQVQGKAYIILDALDEVFPDERLEFFDLAQDIQPGGRLQLLLLGRPHIGEEMNYLMELLRVPTIFVSSENNSHDIVQYIQVSIKRSARLRKLPSDLQSEVIRKLSTGAQGMFIWVGFMLQELQRVRDHGGIDRALNSAPKGLSSMIQHVLRGFSELLKETPEYADDLNELLTWVVCSSRPLSLTEVECILKWKRPGGGGWICLEGDLRGQFASLFVLTREDRMTTAELLSIARDGVFNEGNSSDSDRDRDPNDDYDGSLDFGSDPSTTDVAFNHASLGDFFRGVGNGKVSAGEEFPFIGVNYAESQALVLIRIFEIITGSDPSKVALAVVLTDVAYRSFTDALKNLDPKSVSDEYKQKIGFLLARLLSDQSAFPAFVGLMTIDFVDKHVLGTFLKWLSDPVVQETLPSTEKQWYDEATSKRPVEILQRISRYYAVKWLIQGTEPHLACGFILHFLEQSRDFSRGVSPEQVFEAAEWAAFEKTAQWHLNVGNALRAFELYDSALESYHKALELESDLLLAQRGIANAYYKLGDLNRASDILSSVITRLEQMEQSDEIRMELHSLCSALGFFYWHSYNHEGSHLMWKKAYQSNPSCFQCISALFRGFKHEGDMESSWALWNKLDAPLQGETQTQLTLFLFKNYALNNVFDYGIIRTIQHLGDASFFTKAYATAALVASQRDQPRVAAWLNYCLGYLHWTHGNEPKIAIAVWEKLIDMYQGKVLKPEFLEIVRIVSDELGLLYLTQCVQSNTSAEEMLRYGTLLERLARNEPLHPSRSHKEMPLANESPCATDTRATFNLGHFYTICGKTEEARECYTAQVSSCFQLLGDEDKAFHQPAFYRLGRALAMMGDTANALAAFYQCNFLSEKTNIEPRWDGGWFCDGCSANTSIDSLTICCFCPDTVFCEGCTRQMQQGHEVSKKCALKHKWLYVAPRTHAVRKRSQEHMSMLYVDGSWMTLNDFEGELKRRYGI